MSTVSDFKTEQESFWAGTFGSEYTSRNQGDQLIASNLALFSCALQKAQRVGSCIEFGANAGLNLRALQLLFPQQQQFAIEINPDAAQVLKGFLPEQNVFNTSILEFDPSGLQTRCDLVLIKGVLIHIHPEFLEKVYEKLYQATSRYLMVCEYYNPTPVVVPYRGHTDRLFKRDFCGEILDCYPALQLVDYGFAYHRDPNFPQDDANWFLLERR